MEQIISIDASSVGNATPKMVMDESAFIKILGSYPHVKSVVVIAIMGSERLGKSFIMNLVANYLGHVMMSNADDDWLESKDPIQGVEWRQERDSVTEGIWIWGEPIVLTLDSGDQVKVLLMDCQGTDNKFIGNGTLNNLITSISMRLSTIHLFNVRDLVTNTDIELLQNVITCLELYQPRHTNGPEILKTLITIHRDWQADNQLGYRDKTPSLGKELYKRFDKTMSFMLPSPGRTISSASSGMKLSVSDLVFKSDDAQLFFKKVREFGRLLYNCETESLGIIRQQNKKVMITEDELIQELRTLSTEKVIVVSPAVDTRKVFILRKMVNDLINEIHAYPPDLTKVTTTEKLDRLKNQLLDAVSKKLTTIKHQLNIRDGIPVLTQDFNLQADGAKAAAEGLFTEKYYELKSKSATCQLVESSIEKLKRPLVKVSKSICKAALKTITATFISFCSSLFQNSKVVFFSVLLVTLLIVFPLFFMFPSLSLLVAFVLHTYIVFFVGVQYGRHI